MADAIDELPLVDELPDGQLPESVYDATLYAEYRRVTADQAGLRRLAMLVAHGAEPAEVFEAVVNEMRHCASADTAGLWRYEPNNEMTKLAAAEHPGLQLAKWPVGTRSPIDGSTLAGIVQRTGRPARMDSYDNSTGSLAARIRDAGVHAAVGVPVIVDGRVWGLVAVGSVEPEPMPTDTEARISAFAELIGTVVVAGHRDEQKRQLLTEASQLSNRLDGLVAGRGFGDWSLRDIAGLLRLPTNGPFVVIVAQVSVAGDEPLPDIESKLRSLNISSAWTLLPDLQVGVARVTSDEKLEAIVALMSRMTTARVGVSAPFEDLRETPTALHVARMMLRGRGASGSSVAVFDNSILAAAVVSAPEAMIRSVGPALDGFSDLPDDEREMLFETFRVWQDHDACVRDAADALFCHPNTVRYRLRKIEARSGRSLARPKDVVELYLAFEVHRRLM
jgi:PucR C-terminal helix-turn-helix domain/GAF domain/GGDEF-like domain